MRTIETIFSDLTRYTNELRNSPKSEALQLWRNQTRGDLIHKFTEVFPLGFEQAKAIILDLESKIRA